MNEIITHAIAAGFPLLAYIYYNRYLTHEETKRLLGGDLPIPKQAPSDWIVYRYDAEGQVAHRWVLMSEEAAFAVATKEKRLGYTGRVFKDGQIRREW